jgi:glycerol-3-phosphate dehydrogenase
VVAGKTARSIIGAHTHQGGNAFSTAAGRRNTRTRESSIVADDAQQPHALTVFGGKITSYRVTAAKVLQMCKLTLEKRSGIADTARLKLEA